MKRAWIKFLHWCDHLEGDEELLNSFLLERRRKVR